MQKEKKYFHAKDKKMISTQEKKDFHAREKRFPLRDTKKRFPCKEIKKIISTQKIRSRPIVSPCRDDGEIKERRKRYLRTYVCT
jgi:hypothetical protein